MAVRIRLRRTLPWAIVMFLVAVFQLMRAAWVDAAIFAVALALVLTPETPRGGSGRGVLGRWRSPSLTLLIPLATGLALALFFAPRHGAAAGVLLAMVGLAVAALAWRSRPAASVPPRRAVTTAVAAWAAVIVVAGLWEASSYLLVRWASVPSDAMPALSELADPLLDTPAGKAVFLLLWLSAGVALTCRGWRPR